MLQSSRTKKRTRDPESAATSNFILIVVMLTLIKRLFSNYYETFLKEKEIVSLSSVLKCWEAPYFYQLTLTVHKVYIVINFISFICDFFVFTICSFCCFTSQSSFIKPLWALFWQHSYIHCTHLPLFELSYHVMTVNSSWVMTPKWLKQCWRDILLYFNDHRLFFFFVPVWRSWMKMMQELFFDKFCKTKNNIF